MRHLCQTFGRNLSCECPIRAGKYHNCNNSSWVSKESLYQEKNYHLIKFWCYDLSSCHSAICHCLTTLCLRVGAPWDVTAHFFYFESFLPPANGLIDYGTLVQGYITVQVDWIVTQYSIPSLFLMWYCCCLFLHLIPALIQRKRC